MGLDLLEFSKLFCNLNLFIRKLFLVTVDFLFDHPMFAMETDRDFSRVIMDLDVKQSMIVVCQIYRQFEN